MTKLKDLPWYLVSDSSKEPETLDDLYRIMDLQKISEKDLNDEGKLKKKRLLEEEFKKHKSDFINYFLEKITNLSEKTNFELLDENTFLMPYISKKMLRLNSGPVLTSDHDYEFDLMILEKLHVAQILIDVIETFKDADDFDSYLADQWYLYMKITRTYIRTGKIDQAREWFFQDKWNDYFLDVDDPDVFCFNGLTDDIVKFLCDHFSMLSVEQLQKWSLVMLWESHWIDPEDPSVLFFKLAKEKESLSEDYKLLYSLYDNAELIKTDPEAYISIHFQQLKNIIKKMKKDFIQTVGVEFTSILEQINNLFFFSNGDLDEYKAKYLNERTQWLLKHFNSLTNGQKQIIANVYVDEELFEECKKDNTYPIFVELYENASPEKSSFYRKRYRFYLAYSYYFIGNAIEAQTLYEEHLIDNPHCGSTLNNLGVIHKNNKDYNKALEYFQKALDIHPEEELYQQNREKAKKAINDLEEKPQRIKEQYFKTNSKHKKIMFTIYKLNGEKIIDDDLLKKVTGLYKGYNQLIKLLLEKELIQYTERHGYQLDPIAYKLAQDWIDPKVERQIIHHVEHQRFRPIFFHESEINLYRALVDLFPQNLVFPNMSLKTIIDAEKMKNQVEPDILNYFYKAHVDFAIISNITYLPIICFEKDSTYHDTDYAKENDGKKNLLFQLAGIPLLRLRFNSNMEYERLKEEVRLTTKELLQDIKQSSLSQSNDLLKQFSLRTFGLDTDLDLEEVKAFIKDKMTDLLYKEVHHIEWLKEEATLLVRISSSGKQLIQLVESQLKNEIWQKYRMINNINFLDAVTP
ncbi:DUF2726 domain-containing protein [Shimazuella sp. AN120528]|uniref:DUF2726 domain-containing protein n=1 Tax=Shimazuella soli TaxID=1892854 RepID=UPI001F0F178F|nr:DUF2726 domain-containing protein [Shimazuella soli]MCH5584575.1 DUF2726 domain-containing protein [Shimazuella soli]